MTHDYQNKKIVCLGGGIGTVNLIKGLRKYTSNITIVVSMADDGGSAGRLRRAYNVLPPGDVVSCLAALTKNEDFAKFLTYRFPGDRYGKDEELAGHKMGNLMMIAAEEVTGSFIGAIEYLKKIFGVDADIFPATEKAVTLHAITVDGREISTEEAIDLGKYDEPRILNKVHLLPEDLKTPPQVLTALDEADYIIAGPGDLYSNLLPVLITPDIAKKLTETKAEKIFILNVANKPFETKGYVASDFIDAIERHMHLFPFDTVVANNNYTEKIPSQFHYDYVKIDEKLKSNKLSFKLLENDLVNEDFPLYHNSEKLAEVIIKQI